MHEPSSPHLAEFRARNIETKCAVCLNDVRHPVLILQCLHTFCFMCLREWSTIACTCPLCKTAFNGVAFDALGRDPSIIRMPTDKLKLPVAPSDVDDRCAREVKACNAEGV